MSIPQNQTSIFNLKKKGRSCYASERSIPKGKEMELLPGLVLKLPFGVTYARNEEGNIDLAMPWPTPRAYRDGPFELDGEAAIA